jgi:ECF sigma factor
MPDVTQILWRIESGDSDAAEQLLPLVYEDCANWRLINWHERDRGRRWRPPRLCTRPIFVWLRLLNLRNGMAGVTLREAEKLLADGQSH